VLYPKARREQTAEVAAEGDGLPADGEARPMSVYRLASNTQLYFSDKSLPVGPGAELIYLSRLKTPDKCFAVELGVDSMSHEGGMSFKRGSILIFSIEQEVASGDFAFVKWRRGDVFAQVFIEKDDSIRIRALNPKYPERAVKRREVRLMFKLVGCYQDFS
jgi:SOS-response transcriptional repressor LexA